MKYQYLVILYDPNDDKKRIRALFVVPRASNSTEAKKIARDARDWSERRQKGLEMCALRTDKFDHLWSWD